METRIVSVVLEELHPTYQMLAKVIGVEAAVKLGREFAGTDIYFPQIDALIMSRRRARDGKIVEDYESGRFTKEELGRKYKMTVAGISSVLKRAKTEGAPDSLHGDAIIEQIKRGLSDLDEKALHRVLIYMRKSKNLSRG